MYFEKVYFDEKKNPTEIVLICNKCGSYLKLNDMTLFEKISMDYCIISNGKKILCECGNSQDSGLVSYKKLEFVNEITIKNSSYSKNYINTVQCPYCQSTDTKKISGTERVLSIATLGLFSNKINKSFKCNNCKGTF